MIVLIVTIILTAILSALFILLTKLYKDYLDKIYVKLETEEKEKSLSELLDRYVVEEKREVMKDKLSKISQIIADTEKEIEETVTTKVKAAKASIKAKGKELDVITKAGDEYVSFTAGLRSAMPGTEEERVQDMKELQDAISMLESFDEETYAVGPKKTDAGVGMFYDRMSRRFKKIITEQKMGDLKFVPAQRIKYHAFLEIKNIKNKDILPILKIMKDTHLLKDIVEINPTFQIIVFTDEKIRLTMPEKVLMTFAYDEDFLNKNKLLKITEWKSEYAKKILKGLKNKELVTILDDVISVEGFGHIEERKKWNELIDKQVKEEKSQEEQKRKRQLERAKQLKSQLAKVESTKVIEQQAQPIEEKSADDIIDSLDDITPTDEEPKKIKFEKKPGVKTLPLPTKSTKPKKPKGEESLDFSLDDVGEEEQDLEDLVPEKILNYHEKFSLINGGLVQYDLIKDYVISELKDVGKVSEELIKTMLKQLKELQMVQSSIKIGKFDFYLFNEIVVGIGDKKFIEFAIGKNPMKKEDFTKGLKWNEEKTLKTMKSLQDKGILRIEKDKIIIPGIVQKK